MATDGGGRQEARLPKAVTFKTAFRKVPEGFERGVRPSRECQGALKDADQRVAKPAKIVGSGH